MSRYKYVSIMRQIDEDPSGSDFGEGTIWIKAGDHSDGTSRRVIDNKSKDGVKVRSEAIAVYGGDRWLTQVEAVELGKRRAKEEDLLEEYDAN